MRHDTVNPASGKDSRVIELDETQWVGGSIVTWRNPRVEAVGPDQVAHLLPEERYGAW
jgi:hypothetical protein